MEEEGERERGGRDKEGEEEEIRGRRGKEGGRNISHQCGALPTAYTRYIWRYTSGLLRMCTILPKSILTGQVFSGS